MIVHNQPLRDVLRSQARTYGGRQALERHDGRGPDSLTVYRRAGRRLVVVEHREPRP